MTNQKEISKYLTKLLNVREFTDYCPNGLQVEGSEKISKMAFAVSATADSVEKAVEWGADALVVHHGLFWKFHGTKPVVGPFAKRVKPLIKNDINLYGYHLPLDAHIEIGNAAAVASKIGLIDLKPFGDHKGSPTGVSGKFKTPIKANDLQKTLASILNHQVNLASPNENDEIRSMGIITGGANGDWALALREGLDSYLTGEMSEHDWHESSEAGIHMFAGGHHATEQFGIQNLQENLEKKFKVETIYIDSNNPA